MTEHTIHGVRVLTAQTADGRAVAASVASPYFLFDADTEEAAIETSKRALAFYLAQRRSPC